MNHEGTARDRLQQELAALERQRDRYRLALDTAVDPRGALKLQQTVERLETEVEALQEALASMPPADEREDGGPERDGGDVESSPPPPASAGREHAPTPTATGRAAPATSAPPPTSPLETPPLGSPRSASSPFGGPTLPRSGFEASMLDAPVEMPPASHWSWRSRLLLAGLLLLFLALVGWVLMQGP